MVFRKYFGEVYLTRRCASVFYNTTYDLKDGAKEKPRNWTRAEILCSVSVSERVRPVGLDYLLEVKEAVIFTGSGTRSLEK